MDTDTLTATYCGTYPERDHRGCPSSVECATATLADLAAEAPAPEITNNAIRAVLATVEGIQTCYVTRTNPSQYDRIQSFNVTVGYAHQAADALTAAGYSVHSVPAAARGANGSDAGIVHLNRVR